MNLRWLSTEQTEKLFSRKWPEAALWFSLTLPSFIFALGCTYFLSLKYIVNLQGLAENQVFFPTFGF